MTFKNFFLLTTPLKLKKYRTNPCSDGPTKIAETSAEIVSINEYTPKSEVPILVIIFIIKTLKIMDTICPNINHKNSLFFKTSVLILLNFI